MPLTHYGLRKGFGKNEETSQSRTNLMWTPRKPASYGGWEKESHLEHQGCRSTIHSA